MAKPSKERGIKEHIDYRLSVLDASWFSLYTDGSLDIKYHSLSKVDKELINAEINDIISSYQAIQKIMRGLNHG